MQNQSEVARILEQIADEYSSARMGLEGLAQGTSRHDFITKRMENMGTLYGNLINLIGVQQATEMTSNRLENL